MGILLYLYIDDGFQANKNRDELVVETKFTIELLEMLGWKINYKKSELEPKKELLVQGLYLNTEKLVFILPEWKRIRIEEQIANITKESQKGEDISAKEMASLYGRLAAIEKAVGNVIAFTRQGQNAVGQANFKDRDVNDPNWDVDVRIRKE